MIILSLFDNYKIKSRRISLYYELNYSIKSEQAILCLIDNLSSMLELNPQCKILNIDLKTYENRGYKLVINIEILWRFKKQINKMTSRLSNLSDLLNGNDSFLKDCITSVKINNNYII